MIGKLQLWFGVAGAVAVALLVAFLKGRGAGRAVEQAKAAAKERKDVKIVTDARAAAKQKSDSELDEGINKWTRR